MGNVHTFWQFFLANLFFEIFWKTYFILCIASPFDKHVQRSKYFGWPPLPYSYLTKLLGVNRTHLKRLKKDNFLLFWYPNSLVQYFVSKIDLFRAPPIKYNPLMELSQIKQHWSIILNILCQSDFKKISFSELACHTL